MISITDTLKLYDRMRETEKDLKELKAEYRDPSKQPPALRIYWNIAGRKWTATLIYMALASIRNRVHRHNDTLEEQQEFLGKHLGKLLDKLSEDKAA